MFKPQLQDREDSRERVTGHEAQFLVGSFGTITKFMLKELVRVQNSKLASKEMQGESSVG